MAKELIFENEKLYNLIKDYLIDDDEFITELDKIPTFTYSVKLSDKNIEDRLKILKGHVIGNTSRTYILEILALNRLYSLLLKDVDKYTDPYWKGILNEYLRGKQWFI